MEKFEQLHANYYQSLCKGYFADEPDMAPTGFKDLDLNMGGYRWGDFVFIASRPGMGASTFMLESAIHLAKDEGYKVGLVRLNRTQEGLNEDLLSFLVPLGYRALWESNLTEETLNKCYLNDELKQIPLYTWVPDTLHFDEILPQLEAYIDSLGLQYIFIDDFDSFTTSQRTVFKNKNGVAYAMCRQLNLLAAKKKIVLITHARLSREVDQENEGRPSYPHLCSIGNITSWIQKALFLYRPAYYGIHENEYGQTTRNTLIVDVVMSKTGDLISTELYADFSNNMFRIMDQPQVTHLITEDWQYSLHQLLEREEQLKKAADKNEP